MRGGIVARLRGLPPSDQLSHTHASAATAPTCGNLAVTKQDNGGMLCRRTSNHPIREMV